MTAGAPADVSLRTWSNATARLSAFAVISKAGGGGVGGGGGAGGGDAGGDGSQLPAKVLQSYGQIEIFCCTENLGTTSKRGGTIEHFLRGRAASWAHEQFATLVDYTVKHCFPTFYWQDKDGFMSEGFLNQLCGCLVDCLCLGQGERVMRLGADLTFIRVTDARSHELRS